MIVVKRWNARIVVLLPEIVCRVLVLVMYGRENRINRVANVKEQDV